MAKKKWVKPTEKKPEESKGASMGKKPTGKSMRNKMYGSKE